MEMHEKQLDVDSITLHSILFAMRIRESMKDRKHPFNLDGIKVDAMVLDDKLNRSTETVHYGSDDPSKPQLTVSGETFHLFSKDVSYIFHVDQDRELVLDHFGAKTDAARPSGPSEYSWAKDQRLREFPTAGRGDLRLPSVHISHSSGHTVSKFEKFGYFTSSGKTMANSFLPQTRADDQDDDVYSLGVFLEDEVNEVFAQVNYSIFSSGAVARSFAIVNQGKGDIVIERAGTALEFPSGELDLVHHYGNWAREAQVSRNRVGHGTQGFQSLAGYSSAHYNPFLALVRPDTNEDNGEAWAMSLIYSGSFDATIEKSSTGTTRATLGLNPLHLSWRLGPGETFQSPECIVTYSNSGLSGISRTLHNLYRYNLCRSEFVLKTRPCLLNNWEATAFDMDEDILLPIAKGAAGVGINLFVMDDAWFGNKYPRVNDRQGLGDWVPNPKRFKHGLGAFVDRVTALNDGKMRMGIWVEPEMVNPKSELYDAHTNWVLHAPGMPRTEGRNQLVLNLGLPEVQAYIINAIHNVLKSADISYVKWDNNRAIHELAHPSDSHRYMLGLYRVLDILTRQFPHVLFEGCASGGGRFDPGLLAFWPQHWTSDNTDAVDRLQIQFGTSLAYPASSMGCHVSAVPNQQTGRSTPLWFRAHVAMMGGGFGFELDLNELSKKALGEIPAIVHLAEKVNPFVVRGDMYRLAVPWESNYPAVQYLLDGDAVVLAYQVYSVVSRDGAPPVKLKGLDKDAKYDVEGVEWSGSELMEVGMFGLLGRGDYQSKVLFVRRL